MCVLLLAVLNLNENLTDCKSPSDKREKLCLKFYFFFKCLLLQGHTQLHPSHTSVTGGFQCGGDPACCRAGTKPTEHPSLASN